LKQIGQYDTKGHVVSARTTMEEIIVALNQPSEQIGVGRISVPMSSKTFYLSQSVGEYSPLFQ
jgi:hypothetical protein